MRFWPTPNTSRPQQCFSSRSRKAAKPDKPCHGWHQGRLCWLVTFCPGTNHSVGTTTLKGHTWKADGYSVELLPLGPLLKFPPLKAFRTEDPVCCPSPEHAGAFSNPLIFPSCALPLPLPFFHLSPKGLFFYLWAVAWAHLFYNSLLLPLWLSK